MRDVMECERAFKFAARARWRLKLCCVVGFDATAFQLRAQLCKVFVVPCLDRSENFHCGNIRAGEGAIMHDLFDARAGRSDLRGEIG